VDVLRETTLTPGRPPCAPVVSAAHDGKRRASKRSRSRLQCPPTPFAERPRSRSPERPTPSSSGPPVVTRRSRLGFTVTGPIGTKWHHGTNFTGRSSAPAIPARTCPARTTVHGVRRGRPHVCARGSTGDLINKHRQPAERHADRVTGPSTRPTTSRSIAPDRP